MEETMDIFELIVPLEKNVQNDNTQKMNKYEHFITDITTRDVPVHPFEIDSRGSGGNIIPKKADFLDPKIIFCP